MRSLAEAVDAFGPDDTTVRLVRGLLAVLPFLPDWRHPGSLDQMCGSPKVRAVVDRLAAEPGPQSALAAFDLLDKADRGIALFSSVKGAVHAARGTDGALELDPQQAADAGLKVAGLAFAAYKLYGGDVRQLTGSDTGRALLAWYVAADVVLPFADNIASGGLDVTTALVDRYAAENAERLAAVAGAEAGQAAGMVAQLADQVRGLVGQAAAFTQPMTAWLQEKLPGFLGGADKVTGVVATGADAFNAYRYLGAVLVADDLVRKAKAEVEATERAEAAAAAKAKAEAEEKARREAQERLSRSAQREDYSLDAPLAADSSRTAPIQYSRSGGDLPEKKAGCMGCASLVLVGLVLAGTAWMVA